MFRNLILSCVLLTTLGLNAAENWKSWNGVAKANIKTFIGVAEANIKSWNGVDNTGGSSPVGFHMQFGTNTTAIGGVFIAVTNTASGANPLALIGVNSFGSGIQPTNVTLRLTSDGSLIGNATLLSATNQFSTGGACSVWAYPAVPTSGSVYFAAGWSSGVNEHALSVTIYTNCATAALSTEVFIADAAPVPGVTNTVSSTTTANGVADFIFVTSLTATTFTPTPPGHTQIAEALRGQGQSQHRVGYLQGAASSTEIGWAFSDNDGVTHVVVKLSPP